MYQKLLATFLCLAAGASLAQAADPALNERIDQIGHRWAKANYETPEKDKDAAFAEVIASAKDAAAAFPGKAEPIVWEAIALSSAAKVEGGFSALKKAREARDLLLTAESIDPTAINGAVYTSLGSLYANVPGWPISFGDKKKARQYLEKAIAMAPADIDSNYFYADFLASDGDYVKSAQYLKHAIDAPPRSGREDADNGRRQEARTLLATLREKHAGQLANN